MKKLLILLLSLSALSCTTGSGGEGGSSGGSTLHTVTVTSVGAGTATADKTIAASGEIITLTASMDPGGEGFALWNVLKGEVTLSSRTETTVSFLMLVDDVEIEAVFGDPTLFDAGITLNGMTWATRNVGAPGHFASSINHEGLVYQFSRPVGWTVPAPITSYPSTPYVPWNMEDADASAGWGDNDPCPAGWRIPTVDEFNALLDETKVKPYWGTTEPKEEPRPGFRTAAAVAISIPGWTFMDLKTRETIFLPAQGYRDYNAVTRERRGERGDGIAKGMYWSAGGGTATSAPCLTLGMSTREIYPIVKSERTATAISVRCVKK